MIRIHSGQMSKPRAGSGGRHGQSYTKVQREPAGEIKTPDAALYSIRPSGRQNALPSR